MKCGVICLGLILTACLPAQAQEKPKREMSKYELSGGYTFVKYYPSGGSGPSLHMSGWNVSGNYNLLRWAGIAADFSGFYKTQTAFDPTINATTTSVYHVYSFLVGPSFFPFGHRRFTPFGHALFGGGRVTVNSPPLPPVPGRQLSDLAFAWLAGGGADIGITRHWALRLIEADVLDTRFFGARPSQVNTRLSAGLVYRFGQR